MKFTVDVDCTPQEARSFIGLPDLKPIHDHYIASVLEVMNGATSVEQMESLFRKMSPLGDAGMRMFSKMMEFGIGASGTSKPD